MTLDIKEFYLNTPMERPEYMRMNIKNFPKDVIDHYKLSELMDAKGNLCVKCVKGVICVKCVSCVKWQFCGVGA